MDMQNEMWAWLLRRVPVEQHNQLMMVTGSGTEIAVQALLRVESDFVAIKGRLAGSQDAGRVFFIPYANIDYFGLQRDVKETEFDAIFGDGSLSASLPAAVAAPATTAVAPAAALPAGPAATSPAEAPASASVSQKTPLPLKSEVLERFRSRIAGATPTLSGPPRPPDA
jgi:hypothetical protein